MLKTYPEGKVRVFFLLHTNKEGKPATTAEHAQQWDDFAKWTPKGLTLADGERKGNKLYFGGVASSNIVLKKGFEVFKRDSENYKADVALALAAK